MGKLTEARIIAGFKRRGGREGGFADCTTLHHFGVPRWEKVYWIRDQAADCLSKGTTTVISAGR
jgi:hypothetical protein